MKMVKRILLGLAAGAVILSLVGCGPKDDDTEAVKDLEVCGSCIRKVSLTQFDGKLWGLSEIDTPYGFTWLAIGY